MPAEDGYVREGKGSVGRSYDVLGDGTLLLVHTPRPQSWAVQRLLRGGKGYIVPDNDGAYLPESFSKYCLPGFTLDKRLAEKSLDWLIACKNAPCAWECM